MMSKVALLLSFCFALATSSAVGGELGLRSLRDQADEARATLSTLSEQCTADISDLVTLEHAKAVYSIFNCSYTEIIDEFGNLVLETVTYAAMDYEVISKLVVKFSHCVAELNPLKVIECGLGELDNAFGEIKSMVKSTENFINDIKSMVPPLKKEIANCMRLSSVEYKTVLKNLVNKAKVCEATL